MKRNAFILFAFRIIRLAASIITLSLSAKFFGVTIERDNWIMALNVLTVIDMAIWGPVNETFRAKFIFLKNQEGESLALDKTKALILIISVVSVLVFLFLELFPSWVSKTIAPGFQEEQLAGLNEMIRYLAPSLLFNQICLIFISFLNAYDSFLIPELSSFISVLINVILLYFLAPIIGVKALIVTYYIGLIILIVLLTREIRIKKIPLFRHLGQVKWKAAWPFIAFALPFFVPYFFGQVNLLIEKSIESTMGQGAVSILDYARKFTDIPMSVMTSVMTAILVPQLSKFYVEKDRKSFVNTFQQMYQMGGLLVTMIIAILISSSDLLVQILYQRGVMSNEAAFHISQLSVYYGFASFSVFLYWLFGYSLLSSGKAKIYAFYGVLAQVLMIFINLALNGQFLLITFPLALGVAHFLAALVMVFYFPYSLKEQMQDLAKYIMVFLVMLILAYFTKLYRVNLSPHFVLIVNIAVLVFVLLICVFVFRLEERYLIIDRFNYIWRRNKRNDS